MPLSFGTYGFSAVVFFGVRIHFMYFYGPCGLSFCMVRTRMCVRARNIYIWLPHNVNEWDKRRLKLLWLYQDIDPRMSHPKNSIFDEGAHNIFH